MRNVRNILILLLMCLLPANVAAKSKKSEPELDESTKQRFLYYYYEAQRLYKKADYQSAYMLIEFCHRLSPNDAVINQYMGDFFFGFKRADLALPFYELSYRKDPKNEMILGRLQQVYYYTRNTKKAIQIQDLLDKRDGYDFYSAVQRYRIYASVADVKNALKEAERYLKQDSMSVEFHLMRLEALEVMKTPKKKLEEAYDQVLRLDPENVTVMNNYAYFLSTHKGDLKKAEEMSRYAVQAEPNNPVFIDTYAWILFLRGEKSLAQMYIRQAMHEYNEQKIPDDVLYHYQVIMNSK